MGRSSYPPDLESRSPTSLLGRAWLTGLPVLRLRLRHLAWLYTGRELMKHCAGAKLQRPADLSWGALSISSSADLQVPTACKSLTIR